MKKVKSGRPAAEKDKKDSSALSGVIVICEGGRESLEEFKGWTARADKGTRTWLEGTVSPSLESKMSLVIKATQSRFVSLTDLLS